MVVLLVAACGGTFAPPGGSGGGGGRAGGSAGGSGTAGGTATTGLPLASACSVLNTSRCEYLARCGLIDDSMSALRDCQAWLLSTWCGPTKWPARVEASTLLYDARLGQSCAEAWPTRSCEEWESQPLPCTRMLSPNASPLQACYDGYSECTENRVCRGAACPRSCQPLGVVGDSCLLDSDCTSLLYCKRAVAVTGAGTCTNLGVASSVCGPDEPCAPGFTCVAGRCLVPPTVGSPCASGGVCDATAWCEFNADGGTCAMRQGAAARCTDDVQCASGYLCQLGRCEPKVVAVKNAMCSDRQTCPATTTCVGAAPPALGECKPPLKVGDECIASDDCERHLACASVDGGFRLTCGERQAPSGSCSVDRDCQLLSRCVGGVCLRLPMLNEVCTDVKACLVGPCVSDGGTSVCVEKFVAGARCSADSDCASGRCVGAICLTGCAP
ncbi:MAG: hypothetical protein JNK82_15580 [Myxococcaceae bacterium]|nr:hypothetical protein [Myxococcaceae bacterium]